MYIQLSYAEYKESEYSETSFHFLIENILLHFPAEAKSRMNAA